jgi:hypothetical protein
VKLGQLMKRATGDHWLIPRYEEYIKNRQPQKEMEVVKGLLSLPERDRSIGWSASSADGCLRQQRYRNMGVEATPPNERVLNIFFNGHYVHFRHQAAGMTAGYLVGVEVPVKIETLNVLGTMDGITSINEGAEFKSINQYGFREVVAHGPKPDHIAQVNAYMLAADLDAFRILYECKNTNQLREFRVEADEDIQGILVERWEKLNKAAKKKTNTLPVLRECKNLEGKYNQCPYAKRCLKDAGMESAK